VTRTRTAAPGKNNSVPVPVNASGFDGATGALLGAAVAPVFQLLTRLDHRSYDNAANMVYGASLETGRTGREIAVWAQSTERRFLFAVSVIQTALNTLDEQKLAGLARVFVRNLSDDAGIEADTVMVQVLADLDTPHIRVLHTWATEQIANQVNAAPLLAWDWAMSQLKLRWPEYANVISPLVATLEQRGLVREVTPAAAPDPVWRITDFGVDCLRFLSPRFV
jgi:hypothetical protein